MITMAVQAAGIAIIATGMVLVIVSRNIDLSVGSLVGFIAMSYALLMTDWFRDVLGIGPDVPFQWVIALALGIGLGAGVGAHPGVHHRLHRRAVVHRHARRPAVDPRRRSGTSRGAPRCPGSTRPSSSSAAVPTARSASHDLDPRRRRLPGHRRLAVLQPPPAAPLRLPGRDRCGPRCCWRRRLRDRAGPGLRSPTTTSGPRASPTSTPPSTASRPAGRRPADPGRLPVPDRAAHRRDAGHDLHRQSPTVRPLRVRLRRQSRCGRAGRHQHALDDPQDLRPDGHPVRARRCHRRRAPERIDARHRRGLRAVRHRRGGGRRHIVRGRHRHDPRRRPGRVRDAVAGLRLELPGRQLARPERGRRRRADRRRRPRHPATAGAAS